jgi:hypothetical protein
VIYDNDEEGAIVLDEGEDIDCESYGDEEYNDSDCSDFELYDTKLDKIDEILFLRDQLNNL